MLQVKSVFKLNLFPTQVDLLQPEDNTFTITTQNNLNSLKGSPQSIEVQQIVIFRFDKWIYFNLRRKLSCCVTISFCRATHIPIFNVEFFLLHQGQLNFNNLFYISACQCTASCGVGMQMRNVMCAKKEGAKILRILSKDQCKKEKEMTGIQKCSVRPCQAGWYIFPWEPVSQTHLFILNYFNTVKNSQRFSLSVTDGKYNA